MCNIHTEQKKINKSTLTLETVEMRTTREIYIDYTIWIMYTFR